MKKGRFLWSAHRITERQKAGKARSIKGKQLKNSRSTVSRQLVELRSSANDNHTFRNVQFQKEFFDLSGLRSWEVFVVYFGSVSSFGVGFLGNLSYYCILSLFYVAHRAGVLNYNPPVLRVMIIVIRKNHLSAL